MWFKYTQLFRKRKLTVCSWFLYRPFKVFLVFDNILAGIKGGETQDGFGGLGWYFKTKSSSPLASLEAFQGETLGQSWAQVTGKKSSPPRDIFCCKLALKKKKNTFKVYLLFYSVEGKKDIQSYSFPPPAATTAAGEFWSVKWLKQLQGPSPPACQHSHVNIFLAKETKWGERYMQQNVYMIWTIKYCIFLPLSGIPYSFPFPKFPRSRICSLALYS